MAIKGDISVYKGMDPDSIYNDDNLSNGSITFYYIPHNQHFYIAQNPVNHRDMLSDNDDLFEDVYADLLKTTKINAMQKESLVSRGQALAKGNAILGRIGIDGTTPLIAFWESERIPLNTNIIGNFLKALYKRLPPFQGYQNKTVLLIPNQNPTTVGNFLGTTSPSPKKTVALKTQKLKNKTYTIAGKNLTLSDLQSLRAAIHTKGPTQVGGDPHVILCHPDIDKYPELQGYKPSTCGGYTAKLRPTHPEMWRRAAREIGQYVYTSESFKEWLDLREALHVG